MIGGRARLQLLAFVVVTLLAAAYVGSQYAQLDRRILDRDYDVAMQLDESGGIFVNAAVTYRGVTVGRVSDLEVADTGVSATLQIDDEYDDIPSDLVATVANRSALGEQYVDLQPESTEGPYLEEGSTIAADATRTPLPVENLIEDVSGFAGSVDPQDLRTVVTELGTAFEGSGRDLGTIIETGGSFLRVANRNFAVTRDLIRSSAPVLDTQVASGDAIQSFSSDLALLSQTLRDSDDDLRVVLDETPGTISELGALLAENEDSLNALFRNLRTVNGVASTRLPGIEGALTLAPYAIEAGYSVLVTDGDDQYRLALSFAVAPELPSGQTPAEQPGLYCIRGVPSIEDAPFVDDLDDQPIDTGFECTEPPSESSVRGPQNIAGLGRLPLVGRLDADSGEFTPSVAEVPSAVDTDTASPTAAAGGDWMTQLYGVTP